MNGSDASTLRARLSEIADALGFKAPSEPGIKAWILALQDFPCPDVIDALDHWLRLKPKMPTPADIRIILAGRLADRIEGKAIAEKAQFAAGAQRILCDPRIAKHHLDKALRILRPIVDEEMKAEREAIQAEGQCPF
jgi:hypothetical protein